MPDCLIVSTIADELAGDIARLADYPIVTKACTSAQQALAEYANETVLFGNPDMVAEILPELPLVDWVQSTWAGVTPLTALDRRDYVLTGMKGAFGSQMSEYVFGHLLAHELKVVQRVQEQGKRNWFNSRSGTLYGKRLGIMGTGTIGQHIAATARCFGIAVTGLSRSGNVVPGFEKIFDVTRLDEFLEDIDYLVAVLPQTAATENLLDADALARLPAHCYFVNAGRGNVVDDAALIKALENGKLAGATLDVFDEEPLPQGNPLWDAPNLSITAHIAAASHSSLIAPVFVDNFRRYKNKQALKFVIDFDNSY